MSNKLNTFLAEYEKGEEYAAYNLGVCYQFGLEGVEIDYLKMLEYYHFAADRGYAKAQNNLGYCYEFGIGVAINMNKALEWYEKAANGGNLNAKCNVLNIAEKGLDYDTRLAQYTELAESGNVRAKYKVGAMLISEKYCDTDKRDRAIEYLEAASDAGYLPASVEVFDNMVDFFLQSDKSRKIVYAKKLAEEGLAEALYFMGKCYLEGDEEEQDEEKAAQFFERAAKLNDANSAFELGKMYEEGKGVVKDEKKAFEYCLLGASLGNAISSNYVGFKYEYGQGTPIDKKKAINYYKFSASKFQETACANLANIYEHGYYGLEIDYKKSQELYYSAMCYGNLRGHYAIGKYYNHGYYNKKDAKRTLELYLKAVSAYTYRGAIIEYLRFAVETPTSDESKNLLTKALKVAADKNLDEIDTFKAICLEKGLNEEKDLEKAKSLLKKTADKALPMACLYMGNYLSRGHLFEKDLEKAVFYYKTGADKFDGECSFKYAVCLRDGVGTSKDLDKAFKYFLRAAEESYPPAFVEVAKSYFKGIGVAKDEAEALKWYEIALKVRDSEALCTVGIWLIEGDYLPQYKSGGAYYLIQAMERYNMEATKRLVDYCDSGVIQIEKKHLEKARRRLAKL